MQVLPSLGRKKKSDRTYNKPLFTQKCKVDKKNLEKGLDFENYEFENRQNVNYNWNFSRFWPVKIPT